MIEKFKFKSFPRLSLRPLFFTLFSLFLSSISEGPASIGLLSPGTLDYLLESLVSTHMHI